MPKKIFLTLVSAFLAWQSFDVVVRMHLFDVQAWQWLLFISWVINMMVTGVFAFAGMVHPTQRLLPDAYYAIHRPDRLEKVYKILKINWFRKFLLATFWKKKEQRKAYFDGSKRGVAGFVESTMKAEFGHLAPFVLLNVVSVYFAATGMVLLGLFTAAFNVLGNLYPVLLQRHHRMRIGRIDRARKG